MHDPGSPLTRTARALVIPWVGDYPKGPTLVSQTLILRWNGTSWKRVPSPTPAGGAFLLGVAAVSARNAWAVGGGLILRWNGVTWM